MVDGAATQQTLQSPPHPAAAAAAALCVYVPVNQKVIIPVACANVTLASMSSASAHGYLEAEGLFNYFGVLMSNHLVQSFIQGHPTTKWYSVMTQWYCVMTLSFHVVVRQCALYYSLDQGMVGLGSVAFFIAIQLPLGFGIVHLVLQKNAAGSLWWHIPLCTICVVIELVNIVVINNSS